MAFITNIFTAAIFLFHFTLTTAAGMQSDPTFAETKKFVADKPELEKLLFELQPTIYITQNGTNTYGEGNPVVVECVPGKLALLYEENPAFAQVKLIKLRINSKADLVVLQLSKLQSFKNLEYVQLIFTYDVCGNKTEQCLLSRVKNMIAPGGVSVTVLYQLSVPE